MAAIFRDIVLNWRDQEYRLKPTMALLNRIEQDIGLSRLAQRISSGDPPLSMLATVIAHFLKAAGAKASSEDVYEAILYGEKEVVSQMAQAVMLAVFPDTGKKADAPQPDTSTSQ